MKKNISQTVRELIEDTVNEAGYSIWDVTYRKIVGDFHLEITIDSPQGIGIEDTTRVSELINPILDEADPIAGFYYLEVSSPGAERELRTDAHLELYIGKRVLAKLFTTIDGIKDFKGELLSYTDGSITLNTEGREIELPRRSISRLTACYEA